MRQRREKLIDTLEVVSDNRCCRTYHRWLKDHAVEQGRIAQGRVRKPEWTEEGKVNGNHGEDRRLLEGWLEGSDRGNFRLVFIVAGAHAGWAAAAADAAIVFHGEVWASERLRNS